MSGQHTQGRLVVQLSNAVPAEADGASVIADAVRIERLAGTFSPGSVLPTAKTAVGNQPADSVTVGPGSTYRVDFDANSAGTNTADQLVAGTFVSSGALLALSASSFNPPVTGTVFRIITPGTFTGAFSNLPLSGDTVDLLAGGQRYTFAINYDPGPSSISNLSMRDANDASISWSPGGISTDEPIVSWDPVPGAASYEVDVTTNGLVCARTITPVSGFATLDGITFRADH